MHIYITKYSCKDTTSEDYALSVLFISVLIFEFGSLSLPFCSTTIISTSSDCSLVSYTVIQYSIVPLEVTAGKGHTKTVQRLLEAGAYVNYQNKVMTTVLTVYVTSSISTH